jgi:sugar transferase (PEP-CTERM system associated)
MFFERSIGLTARGIFLFLGDLLVIFVAMALAAILRLGPQQGLVYLHANEGALWTSAAIFLLVFYIGGLYERKTLTQQKNLIFPCVATVLIGLVLIIIVFYARFDLLIGRGVLFLGALFAMAGAWSSRTLYRMIAGYGIFSRHALIVGEGRDVTQAIRLLQSLPDTGYKIYGIVTYSKGKIGDLIDGVPIVGHVDNLKSYVRHYRAETLIIAASLAKEHALLKILRPLRYAGIELLDYASFYERIAQEIPLDHIDDEWLMHAAMNSSRIHIRKLKRIMDVVVAVAGLVLSLPVCLITAILVKLDSPGPVLYRQRRLGLDSQPYTVTKFRTMRTDAETQSGAVWSSRNDARITRVGRFLRKSRIDEIPQLINVLRGEMSLVGPRPERPEFVEELAKSIPFYKERLLVPPGITGWAQVCFPYASSVNASRRKLQFDLYYIKHMSLVLDIVVLLRTFKTILVGLRHSEDENIEAEEIKTAPALTVLSAGNHDESKKQSKTA